MFYALRALLLVVLSVCCVQARPNVVFIYTDDQGAWTVRASGNPQAHTPNIDRLYQDGCQVVNSFVNTPVCSPSRASLMTSRHGSELMILDWIRPGPEDWLGLDPTLPTWPRLFQKAGYRTALIGKWHIGRTKTPVNFHPTNFGYDLFMGRLEGGWKVVDSTMEKNGVMQKFPGLTEDVLTTEAIEFIEKNREGPFLLSLHYRAPHAAWLPVGPDDSVPHKKTYPDFKRPTDGLEGFKEAAFQKDTRDYYSSVTCVDRNVGRLMSALERLGLEDNTLVIFTSDHGYNVGHYGLWSKGNAQKRYIPAPETGIPNIPARQRPNLYDTSLRVPCAVKWPGRIPAGRKTERFMSNVDWFPTLCEAAGVSIPEDVMLRGKSVWSAMTGEGEQAGGRDDSHYAEWDMRQGAYVQMRSIRTPHWKLVIDFLNEESGGDARGELYDLVKDPDEQRNLFGLKGYASVQRQLTTRLVREMKRIDAGEDESSEVGRVVSINFASANRYDILPPGKVAGKVKRAFWNTVGQSPRGAGRTVRVGLYDGNGERTSLEVDVLGCEFGSLNEGRNRLFLDSNELMQQGFVTTAGKGRVQVKGMRELFGEGRYDVVVYLADDDGVVTLDGEAGELLGHSGVGDHVLFADRGESTVTLDGTARIVGLQLIGR